MGLKRENVKRKRNEPRGDELCVGNVEAIAAAGGWLIVSRDRGEPGGGAFIEPSAKCTAMNSPARNSPGPLSPEG
jgi:hypothetical protein